MPIDPLQFVNDRAQEDALEAVGRALPADPTTGSYGGTATAAIRYSRTWNDIANQFRQQFPDADAEEARNRFLDTRQRAFDARMIERAASSESARSAHGAHTALAAVPAVRHLASSARSQNVEAAAERLRDGAATHEDYIALGEHQRSQEETAGRSRTENIGAVISQIPAFGAEIFTGTPIHTAVAAPVRAGGAALLGTSTVARGLSAGAGAVAGTAAVTGTTGLAAVGAGAFQRTVSPVTVGFDEHGQPSNVDVGDARTFVEALPAAAADTFIELLSERAGGALTRGAGAIIGGAARYSGAQRLFSSVGGQRMVGYVQQGIANRLPQVARNTMARLAFARGGADNGFFHGAVGEYLEERFADVLRGATLPSLGDENADYGATGDLAAGRFREFFEQSLIEGAAFSLYGSGQVGANMATNRLPGRGSREFTIQRRALATQLWQAQQQGPEEAEAQRLSLQPHMAYFQVTPENMEALVPEGTRRDPPGSQQAAQQEQSEAERAAHEATAQTVVQQENSALIPAQPVSQQDAAQSLPAAPGITLAAQGGQSATNAPPVTPGGQTTPSATGYEEVPLERVQRDAKDRVRGAIAELQRRQAAQSGQAAAPTLAAPVDRPAASDAAADTRLARMNRQGGRQQVAALMRETFTDVKPGEKPENPGELVSMVEGRPVAMSYDPARKAVQLDFGRREGEMSMGKSMRPGSRQLLTVLTKLVGKVKDSGLNLTYGTDAKRAKAYAPIIEAAGFKLIGTEPYVSQQGEVSNAATKLRYIWAVPAAVPAAQPASTAPTQVPQEPVVDRRQDGRTGDRRKDTSRRKALDQMTPEEKDLAIQDLRGDVYIDQKTGLKNETAYNDAPRQAFQVYADVDGLKHLNTLGGHPAGDQLIKAVAEAYKAEGIDAYRASRAGDEFLNEGDQEADLDAQMKRVQDRLRNMEFVFESPSTGKRYLKKGIGISYGVGSTLKEAELKAEHVKQQREKTGERESRESYATRLAADPAALPPGVFEVAAPGREAGGGEVQGPDSAAAPGGVVETHAVARSEFGRRTAIVFRGTKEAAAAEKARLDNSSDRGNTQTHYVVTAEFAKKEGYLDKSPASPAVVAVPEAEPVAPERAVAPSPFTTIPSPPTNEVLDKLLNEKLGARERHIIRERLTGRTLEDVALDKETRGGRKTITRERVRQIEEEALEKLGLPEGKRSIETLISAVNRASAAVDSVERGDTQRTDRRQGKKLKTNELADPVEQKLAAHEAKRKRLRALKSMSENEQSQEKLARLTDRYMKETKNGKRNLLPGRQSWFDEQLARISGDPQAKFGRRAQEPPGEDRPAPSVREGDEQALVPANLNEPAATVPYETPVGDPFYGGKTPAIGPGAQGQPTSPFAIIQTIAKTFSVPYYVGKVAQKANAVFLHRPEAVKIRNIDAGNAPIFMHEAAHAIEKRDQPLLGDLPGPVAAGLRRMDYDPQRENAAEGIREGFAEYIRMRVTGQFDAFVSHLNSPALEYVQAAANHIDGKLTDDTKQRLAVVAGMFSRFAGMGAQQATGLVSTTGIAADPQLTTGQKAEALFDGVRENLNDAVDDNYGPLVRATNEAQRRGRKFDVRPDVLARQIHYMAEPWAEQFLEKGVFTIKPGSMGEDTRVKIGPSFEEITSGLTPEDLQPLGKDQPSRFSTFAIARHVLDEAMQDRPTVSEEQLGMFQAFMNDAAKDQEFFARATASAERLTAAFNSTLDALVDVGFLDPVRVAALKASKPTYLPLARVRSAVGWKSWFQRKGETLPTPLKKRQGSGEQIVDPLASYLQRLHMTASLMTRQLERRALDDLAANSEGIGKWMIQVPRPNVPTTFNMGQLEQALEAAGIDKGAIADVMDLLPPDAALSYFTPAAWPTSGKPTYVAMRQGKPIWYEVGQRDFYDLITGQQGQAGALGTFLKGMGVFKPFANVVRFGATTANYGFQIFNAVFRDPWTFLSNTARPGSIKDLPQFLLRSYQFAVATATGRASQDTLMKLYTDFAGGQQRMFAMDPKDVRGNLTRIRQQKSLTGAAKAIWRGGLEIAGAGEMAPRALELRNYLLQSGLTEDEIAKRWAEHPEEDPVAFAVMLNARQAAANVTVDWSRLGYHTRQWNKVVPFFGPAIAGMSNFARNAKANPTRYLAVIGGMLGLSLLHWLRYRDEEWYNEIEPYNRARFWYVKTPWGALWRIPKPLGPAASAMSFFEETLRQASNNNPQFGAALAHAIESTAPPLPWFSNGEPAPLNVALDLAQNRAWTGREIVPARERNLPAREQFLNRQLPYAAGQMSGGLLDPRRYQGNPLEVRGAPDASVDEYYRRLHDLESQRTLVRRQGLNFPEEREYQALHSAERQMQLIARELRGERLVNGRVAQVAPPTEARRQELARLRLQLAQQALAYRRQLTPR